MSEPQSIFPGSDPELAALDLALARLIERRAVLTAARGFAPAAEAGELRRVFADRTGPDGFLLPVPGDGLKASALAQVWRALVMSGPASAGNFSLVVWADDPLRALDLARAYFGGMVPILLTGAAQGVLKAVADGAATVGLLPDPAAGAEEPAWWTHLVSPVPGAPRIFAQLPFVQDTADVPPVYAVARQPLAPSGDDTTLIVAIGASDVSRMRLVEAVQRAGLEATLVAASRAEGDAARQLALVALNGFVPALDARLKALEAGRFAPVERIELVGAYANPLKTAPPAPRESAGEDQESVA